MIIARPADLPTAAVSAANDIRDDEPVEFGGEMTMWGDLSCYERKAVRRTPDGRLVGSFAF